MLLARSTCNAALRWLLVCRAWRKQLIDQDDEVSRCQFSTSSNIASTAFIYFRSVRALAHSFLLLFDDLCGKYSKYYMMQAMQHLISVTVVNICTFTR